MPLRLQRLLQRRLPHPSQKRSPTVRSWLQLFPARWQKRWEQKFPQFVLYL